MFQAVARHSFLNGKGITRSTEGNLQKSAWDVQSASVESDTLNTSSAIVKMSLF